jgi:curved DNA-binding protein CbpA
MWVRLDVARCASCWSCCQLVLHALESCIGRYAVSHYDVLRVPIDADDGTIRSAFRRLVRQYHPDVGMGSSSERFREVTEAYETLIDPVRRKVYDQSLNYPRRIPIHVEPLRANRQPYRSSPIATIPVSSDRIAIDFAQIVEGMFAAFEEEFFFRWGRFR